VYNNAAVDMFKHKLKTYCVFKNKPDRKLQLFNRSDKCKFQTKEIMCAQNFNFSPEFIQSGDIQFKI